MYRVFLSRLFPHETRQSIFYRLKFFQKTRRSIISRLKFVRNERVNYFSSQICTKRESLLFLVTCSPSCSGCIRKQSTGFKGNVLISF